MPRTKCPTVRSGGTTRVRSALMPTLMISRASMGWCSTSRRRPCETQGPIPRDGALRQEGRRLPKTMNAGDYGSSRPVRNCALGEDDERRRLLALHGLALNKGLAALHLVSQRRFVDLDDDGIGIDAEVLHQRLRDVAHHAGLLFIGAAGGHAHGNFRHFFITPFALATSLLPRTLTSS